MELHLQSSTQTRAFAFKISRLRAALWHAEAMQAAHIGTFNNKSMPIWIIRICDMCPAYSTCGCMGTTT